MKFLRIFTPRKKFNTPISNRTRRWPTGSHRESWWFTPRRKIHRLRETTKAKILGPCVHAGDQATANIIPMSTTKPSTAASFLGLNQFLTIEVRRQVKNDRQRRWEERGCRRISISCAMGFLLLSGGCNDPTAADHPVGAAAAGWLAALPPAMFGRNLRLPLCFVATARRWVTTCECMKCHLQNPTRPVFGGNLSCRLVGSR